MLLTNYHTRLPSPPTAIVIVSSHWQAPQWTVASGDRPQMLFEYPTFPTFPEWPEHTYSYRYDARGSPGVAARVQALLQRAGLSNASDPYRGWDHGVWVPTSLLFPTGSVPIVALSLRQGLDAAEHIAAGRALSRLRDEGVLIIGSGATFYNTDYFSHNTRNNPALRDEGTMHCIRFDSWLRETLCSHAPSPGQREEQLARWRDGHSAAACHPPGGEHHFYPLLFAMGAGEATPAECICDFGCGASHLAWSCFEWV